MSFGPRLAWHLMRLLQMVPKLTLAVKFLK